MSPVSGRSYAGSPDGDDGDDDEVCLSSELFSAPTLSMAPSEVFQGEQMTLTCRSESLASERLRRDQLIYSLVPPDHLLLPTDSGVFTGKALAHDFSYTCEARANGLVKRSPVLMVHPKGEKRARRMLSS